MLACGLATHYIRSEEVPVMEEQLKKLLTDDPSVVESCLEKCAEVAHPEKTGVIRRIDLLEKCFSHDTVEEIIDSLVSFFTNDSASMTISVTRSNSVLGHQEIEASRRKDTWCITTLRRLKESSPLSLKVALRSVSSQSTLLVKIFKKFKFPFHDSCSFFKTNPTDPGRKITNT
jgi:3-hydroxyisobutyryl-CoA hydrolase